MSRPIRATIDIAALRHNLSVIRKYVQHTPVMAVIKADAYGHGLLNTAHALNTVDAFAVLELEAAVQLREAGFQQPVLLLEGFFSISELEVLTRYRLSTVIHNSEQLSMLSARNQTKKLDIFSKSIQA
jgi:alanine racemase